MPNSPLSYCQIMIGRTMAGTIGLQEMMEALHGEGLAPDAPGLGRRLVEEFQQHNYVPASAAMDYEQALLREYQEYLEARQSGKAARVWHDPRKELFPWYPTLFEGKCDGCGACVPACPRQVLGWNPEKTKALVMEPYECAKGCQLCARACSRQAIVMPPVAVLQRRV
jgi:NAD-dependent dihydropyrimidine dehydrogenase PreA subunit